MTGRACDQFSRPASNYHGSLAAAWQGASSCCVRSLPATETSRSGFSDTRELVERWRCFFNFGDGKPLRSRVVVRVDRKSEASHLRFESCGELLFACVLKVVGKRIQSIQLPHGHGCSVCSAFRIALLSNSRWERIQESSVRWMDRELSRLVERRVTGGPDPAFL